MREETPKAEGRKLGQRGEKGCRGEWARMTVCRQPKTTQLRRIHRGHLHLPEVQLYYEVIGQGQPMLLLHGNRQSHHIFHEYMRSLAENFQLILMDSRAHGHSTMRKPFTEVPFSIQDMAEDVRQLLDHLGIQKIILFGYSDGANIALEFASRYPERTEALISVSGNAFPTGLRFPVWFSTQLEGHILDRLQRHLPEGTLRTALRQQLQTNRLLTDAPHLPAERLQHIQAPTLLLAGTHDLIKTSHTRWMAAQIPHSELCLIEHGTHQALFQKKECCLHEIQAFLKKNVPACEEISAKIEKNR